MSDGLEEATGGGHGGHMAASFTDLMTSLMVVFVLLFVATLNNAGTRRRKVHSDLLRDLRARLAAVGLDSASIRPDERDPFAIIIVMPDSLIFERGSAEVRPGGQRYLTEVTPAVAEILCAEDVAPNIDHVVVEGHTDTTYVGVPGRRTPDEGRAFNLRLSQERSMEVVKVSLAALQARPQRACFRSMISASGRGQEELIASLPGDHPQQRRVIIKIRVRADMLGDLTRRVPSAGSRVQQRP